MSDYIKKGGVTEDERSIAMQEAQLKLKFRTLLDRITKASNRICHIRAQIYTTLDLPCN